MVRWLLAIICITSSTAAAIAADQVVRLVEDPHVSPDGKSVVFSHKGDLWQVSIEGGPARRITAHPAEDSEPRYSPDGKQIAFVSDRSGSRQIFLVGTGGSEIKQLTSHTEGYALLDWFPDGKHLLVLASRDHEWKSAQRLFKINVDQQQAEQLIFDESASQANCSPNGQQLLYTTNGERWWRKGYRGSRAAQIWRYDLQHKEFNQILQQETESLHPTWKPDASGFYFCSSHGSPRGARNVWEYTFETKSTKQITHFDDDLVGQLTLSHDGQTLLFTHLFDLYRLDLSNSVNPQPVRIEVSVGSEDQDEDLFRRRLTEAADATISPDGLEIVFLSGGDLWTMETVLREPVQITATAEFETDPIMIQNGRSILCVGWKDGQADIVQITRADEKKYWWQNSEFHFKWLTNESSVESDLTISPDGKKLAYIRQPGDLWIYDLETGANQRIVKGFNIAGFDFSPDSQWMTYAKSDNDFNSDIWIHKLDDSSPPINITRHPANEVNPKWSSDGSMIAFTGRRTDLQEQDLYYVYLTKSDHDTGARDRKLKKTLQAFQKSREQSAKNIAPAANESPTPADKTDEKSKVDRPNSSDKKSPVEIKIDFDQLHRRVRQISIANSTESILGWQPGGPKLFFSATVDGQRGTYSVEIPDELTPKKVSSDTGRLKAWLKSPERIFWLINGVPATQPVAGGSGERFTFSALQPLDLAQRNSAAFDAAWRTMRDKWYDQRLGNNNWDAIGRKYRPTARTADMNTLANVIHLMLGELNGSHLGFTPTGDLGRKVDAGDQWRPVTGHLGARIDRQYQGPGWLVKDVVAGSPADDLDSRLTPGEVILSIDGVPVDPLLDTATVLTGPPERDVLLRVKAIDGTERDVTLRPTTYGRVRSLLYQKWQDDNRKLVSQRAPEDNIGYLHIAGMNWTSFLDFQRELYEVGFGKDGLIIDVRDNGGGSTADHLLTALTQPRHAITVPRGGGPGYPTDRLVYASWHKPIVVLCNQNSYSNAEIFTHAIKTLGRGKVVGVPTAGGVVSTGSANILDVGILRLPFRGWFVRDTGQDMELNGAVPDIIVWPKPTEMTSGKDRQLNRAIKVMQQSIQHWKSAGEPELIKATERK